MTPLCWHVFRPASYYSSTNCTCITVQLPSVTLPSQGTALNSSEQWRHIFSGKFIRWRIGQHGEVAVVTCIWRQCLEYHFWYSKLHIYITLTDKRWYTDRLLLDCFTWTASPYALHSFPCSSILEIWINMKVGHSFINLAPQRSASAKCNPSFNQERCQAVKRWTNMTLRFYDLRLPGKINLWSRKSTCPSSENPTLVTWAMHSTPIWLPVTPPVKLLAACKYENASHNPCSCLHVMYIKPPQKRRSINVSCTF